MNSRRSRPVGDDGQPGTLPELVVGAGLVLSKTWASPIVHTTLASARAAGGPFDRAIADAVADHAISEAEAADYVASLVEADDVVLSAPLEAE